ncbi:hypothetical protein DPN68_04320 [Flavobacterium tibetense]|jgi:hypothetical protein|uniref:Uncharacterized protein n=1 Tax=Flavobacterium tibetense TaxID=2233533 RepID=A0A365P3B8_9FLAO|nr:hypothetical protein DPN68_04320 [Flavobacterium tibetense]
MGIILLFYYIVILAVLVVTFLQIFLFRKEINFNKTIVYSFLISILFLLITYLVYANSKEVYAFGPFFLIPFITIVIPFGLGSILNLGSILKIINQENLKVLSHSLLISIIVSTIIMVIFNEHLDVIERFNLEIYY